MINHQQIKEVLWHLNSEPTDSMISWEFTGFVAGISFALKNRKLAEEADKNLQTEWKLGLNSPGGAYGPGEMADILIKALKPRSENGNS